MAVLEIFFLLLVVMVLFLEVAFVFEQKLAYLFQAAHFISLATVVRFGVGWPNSRSSASSRTKRANSV